MKNFCFASDRAENVPLESTCVFVHATFDCFYIVSSNAIGTKVETQHVLGTKVETQQKCPRKWCDTTDSIISENEYCTEVITLTKTCYICLVAYKIC